MVVQLSLHIRSSCLGLLSAETVSDLITGLCQNTVAFAILTGSHYIVQAGPKLLILFCKPSEGIQDCITIFKKMCEMFVSVCVT